MRLLNNPEGKLLNMLLSRYKELKKGNNTSNKKQVIEIDEIAKNLTRKRSDTVLG